MGCNDSKNMKRDFQTSRFDKTTKNFYNQSKIQRRDLNNDKFPQNSSQKMSRLAPFYGELQEMYQSCNRDLKKFITMIEERVSQIYIEISRQTLLDMNHDEIAAEQSKIVISEEILSLNLNILKVIGRSRNFEYDKQTFKELNKFQHHLVGYLKTKYPRGQQTFVSGELMNLFKQFDRVNDLEYDMLKNSNTYFGEADQEKIIKGIKIFMNKVIKQCDKYFPDFQKLMQQRAFFIKNQKNQKISLNYKIGRKIPDNVSKYEKFDTDVLQISSPQIFRVLIKWMEDLEETITKTSQKISKKQSFKCYVGEKPFNVNQPNPNLEKDQKQILFDYINQYEYSEIVDTLITRIEDLKPKLQNKNESFMNELDEFNQTLLKILNQADPRQKYVPTKQIETIKYSSFNAKFVEYILAEKLVYAIKQLIKVGKTFISENMMNLDVIKFRITDLMRCQVSGNKKQILQVYNNFRKLQQQEKIQIVKIKNRLSTPLNDAMIIFKITGCWIICEAQLILSEAGDKIDKKSKNTELVNHYFYQLQRSPYGIMAQIAVLMTYKDSKISYQDKITFHQSNIDIQNCKEKHREQIIETQEQQVPFICSKCSKFYSKSQNLFKFYQCKKCKISVCSKCILKKNPELQTSFIMRDIQRQLQQKIDLLSQSSKQKKQTLGAKPAASMKDIAKKLTPKNILGIFCSDRLKFKQRFDSSNQKKQGIRKVSVLKLMKQLDNTYGIDKKNNVQYFLVVNFFKGQSDFKLYSYDPDYKEIQNTFDSRQKYDTDSYFSYSEFDLLLMIPKNQKLKQQLTINQHHLYFFVTKKQLQAKIDQVKRLKAEGKINKDENYKIISKQLQDTSELVLDYRAIVQKKNKKRGIQEQDYDDYDYAQKKQFKYPSLAVLAEKLPALKSARTTIEFDDLGIQTKHLEYFRNINWRHDIKELKITNNKIEDITIILDNLNCLQRFYFNDNYVKQLKFNKPLPNIQILNGTRNMIVSIQGLANISQVRKLLLGNNKLKQFPRCKDLKVLNVLSLKQNYLSQISNILTSDFPQLQQLIISGQLTQYDQAAQQISGQAQADEGGIFGAFTNPFNKRQKQLSIVIENQRLKNFESQDNEELFIGKQITFQSDSLQKISLNDCYIDRISFSRRECLQNLKYLHLSGNKISVFSFLSANQSKSRRLKDSSVSNEVDMDNKPINNDSLIQLKLSYNEIEYLPVMRFSSLRKLQLQGNQIKDIRSLQKSKIPQLQELNLSQNHFPQVCPLNFVKLISLDLHYIEQLQNVNRLFNGESQLGMLQRLSFSDSNKIDFTFNVNPNTNSMIKLKQLHFNNCKFNNTNNMSNNNNNKDQKQAIFDIPSLQILGLQDCKFRKFPILRLPKMNQLYISVLYAQSFKNIQKSSFKSIQNLILSNINQITYKGDDIHIINSNPQPNAIKKQVSDLGKFLNCDFKFSQLKSINISNSYIASLKGLQSNTYLKLNSLRLVFITTKDGKLPRIKAPNITQVQLKGFILPNADLFIGNNFSKVIFLSLQNNSIQTISDVALSSLIQVKTLSLQDNKIKKFVCSKVLDKLVSLNLSCNQITSFPRIKAKNLSDFRWDGNVFTDLNELTNCQLPAMDQIDIHDCDLSKSGFPRLNMSNLQILKIFSCKLNNLTNLTKSNLPVLRQLDLSFNQIVTLPVLQLPQLMILNLQNNEISDLSLLQKSKLQSLSELRINCNKFNMLPKQLQLNKLKIFYCQYVTMAKLPQLQCSELQQLYVQYCQIVDIDDFCKGDYKSLNYIDMSNNNINNLPRVNMQSLRTVIFDNNQIQDIGQFLIDSNLPIQLQWISFEHNKLTKIPNLTFINLNNIYLNGNPLKQFNSFTMAQYPKLQGLYLNNTQLRQLKNIKKLSSLQNLDISYSKVQNIDWLIQSALNIPKLNYFDASFCNINKVPNIDALKQLGTLYLQGNPVKYIDALLSSTIFSKLQSFNIGLDVGDDFEKIKKKIIQKNKIAQVQKFNSEQGLDINKSQNSSQR